MATMTTVANATMKVAQISKPGGDFQLVERQIPKPEPGQDGKAESERKKARYDCANCHY